MRTQEFRLLARVIVGLSLRRIVPHRDITRLSELCDVIIDDYAELTQTRAMRRVFPEGVSSSVATSAACE